MTFTHNVTRSGRILAKVHDKCLISASGLRVNFFLLRFERLAVLKFPLYAGYNVCIYHCHINTRVIKSFHRGCKTFFACCGGVTHFALAPDEDKGVMTIAWGQSAANCLCSRVNGS